MADAMRDAEALPDGSIDYECRNSANGFGRTCGWNGHATCDCKARTRANAVSWCSDTPWAPEVIEQCHALGASRETM